MSDHPIKQETWIPHEDLSKTLEEWAKEAKLDELPEEAQRIMRTVFTEGWSACLHTTISPARDLAMMLLQMIQLGRSHAPDNPRIMLGGQPLKFIEELCHKLVGQPEDWQLDDMIDAVQVTDETEADFPEEIREALRQARKAAKEGKEN